MVDILTNEDEISFVFLNRIPDIHHEEFDFVKVKGENNHNTSL